MPHPTMDTLWTATDTLWAYGDIGVMVKRVPLLRRMNKYLYVIFKATQLCTIAVPLSKYQPPRSSDKPGQDEWWKCQPQTNNGKWSFRGKRCYTIKGAVPCVEAGVVQGDIPWRGKKREE